MNRHAYLTGPVVFVAGLLALFVTWLVMEPAALHHAFDQDGYSPFELATIPFYAAIIPLVWWKCPFTGSRARRTILCLAVSCVAFMAVVKEMDLHVMQKDKSAMHLNLRGDWASLKARRKRIQSRYDFCLPFSPLA